MESALSEIIFDIRTEDRKPEDDIEIQLKKVREEMKRERESKISTD